MASKTHKQDIVFLTAFSLIFLFLIWKAQFGFANIDEAFNLTTPLRLYYGDRLFVEEWHLSQMSSVLLLPFVSVFMAVKGSTDGILLTFRYLYLLVHASAVLAVYRRLRKINSLGAAFAGLCCLIYAPFGLSALSYNSMCLDALTLTCVLYATGKPGNAPLCITAGLLLGCAVLCNPYLVSAYLYFSAVMGFLYFYKKEKAFGRDWLFVTLGAGIAAAAFLTFVFSRITVAQLIDSFEPILSDPEHPSRTPGNIVITYVLSIFNSVKHHSLPVYCGLALVFVLGLLDRRQKLSRILLLTGILLTAYLLCAQYTVKKYPNFFMFPINILALCCMPLGRDCRRIKPFLVMWIPGMLYSFCIHCASNQMFYAISSASAAAFPASAVILCCTVKEQLQEVRWNRVLSLALAGLMSLQLFTELSVRYSFLFWEKSMAEQVCLMDAGPEKGIRMSAGFAEKYTALRQAVLSSPEYQQAQSVLFLSDTAWLYLLGPKNFSTYSGWLSGVDEISIARLADYFERNPHKRPDCIFLEEMHSDCLPLALEQLSGGTVPVILLP